MRRREPSRRYKKGERERERGVKCVCLCRKQRKGEKAKERQEWLVGVMLYNVLY